MKKTKKNSFMIILIVVILFIIICVAYNNLKKEPANANVENSNLVDENTGLDNVINELFENVIMVNETAEGNKIKDDNEEKNEQKENKTSSSESITSKEEKALKLVKEAWGEDSGVYFSNESIDSKGRYIVSVRNKNTTSSLAFFIVDVDKELVTKQ